jgi:DNA-binding NtrC family response regulator
MVHFLPLIYPKGGVNYMKRVLLADDEESLLLAFRKLLQGPGMVIDTSQTLTDAQKLIHKYSYDIIIADLRLTGTVEMEGLSIVSDAKKLYPNVNIIILTAYGDSKIRERVKNAGVSYFFEKPVSVLQIKKLFTELGIYSGNCNNPSSFPNPNPLRISVG